MTPNITNRIYRGILINLMVFLLVVVLLLVAGFLFIANSNLQRLGGQAYVAGLQAPVTVWWDDLGVPHIQAKNLHDLMFASGMVQAQDRLFQMDLARRVATGRLSELVGEDGLDADRWSRLIGIEELAERNLNAAPPESRMILEAYAAGVNHYLENHAENNPPLEYRALRARPEKWRALDSMAIQAYMAWSMSADWDLELLRHAIAAERGMDAAMLLTPPHSGWGPYIIPPELWPGGTASQNHEPARAASLSPAAPLMTAAAIERLIESGQNFRKLLTGSATEIACSNSWAVSGSRTKSGKSILCNDPHMEFTLPSVWYLMHLRSPDFEEVGTAFPGNPVVILGHSRTSAWAATTTMSDNEDLFLLEINPGNPAQYRYRGQWTGFELREEKINIRDGEHMRVETMQVRSTRLGPVISDLLDPELRPSEPVAVRWIGTEPSDPVGAFVGMARAGNWEEFRHAVQKLGSPIQNWVFAGASGEIGYIAAGWFPLRPAGCDGAFPARGDRCDWTGFVPLDRLPQMKDPPSGFIVTANNPVLPPGRVDYIIGHNYTTPYRASRIRELLESYGDQKLGKDEMVRIQMDIQSQRAKLVLPAFLAALDKVRGSDERLERAYRQLEDWDMEMRSDDGRPLLFAEAWRQTVFAILEDELSLPLFRQVLGVESALYQIDLAIQRGESPLFDDRRTPETESLDDMILIGFRRAIDRIEDQDGPRMSVWEWGEHHRLRLVHPLGDIDLLRPAANFVRINLGPYPLGGDRNTVNNGYYSMKSKDFEVRMGAAMRHIVDFGNLDESVISYPGGQSGTPFSRHYSDFVEPWLSGRGHPVPLTAIPVEDLQKSGDEELLFMAPPGMGPR